MRDDAQCSNCNEMLSEEYLKVPRIPCPKCGSTARHVPGSVSLIVGAATVSATAMVSPSPPSFLLQAVIEVGERVTDGDIIIAMVPAWTAIIELLNKDRSISFQIDPRKWEEIIAGAYERAGFDEVILTPRSGDLGRDVIAVRRGLWTVRILDQVKAYAPGHMVPANDVRAILGVLQADRRATKGVVTTTSDFAPKVFEDPFIAPFVPERLELINGIQLIDRLTMISKGQQF